MPRMNINGVYYEVPDNANFSCINGKVYINGVLQNGDDMEKIKPPNVNIIVEGVLGSIKIEHAQYTTVTVNGDVGKDVDASGDVEVKGNVGGNVDVSGSLKCGDVGGDVDASGTVNCGNIKGSVDASGSVNCGDVGGDIDASGSVIRK